MYKRIDSNIRMLYVERQRKNKKNNYTEWIVLLHTRYMPACDFAHSPQLFPSTCALSWWSAVGTENKVVNHCVFLSKTIFSLSQGENQKQTGTQWFRLAVISVLIVWWYKTKCMQTGSIYESLDHCSATLIHYYYCYGQYKLKRFLLFSLFVVLLLHDKLFINECVLRGCENWRNLAWGLIVIRNWIEFPLTIVIWLSFLISQHNSHSLFMEKNNE